MTSKPLRILAVTSVYSHPDWRGGGVARVSTDDVMVLARRGHEVTMISPLVDGNHQFDLPVQREFFDGHLKFIYSQKAQSGKFGTTRADLIDLLSDQMPAVDLVHIHSFLSPWTDAAAAFSRQCAKPYFVQPHGKLTASVMSNRAWAKRAYLRWRGWSLLRDANAVIFSAEGSSLATRSIMPSVNAVVCPNGLDPSEFACFDIARPIEGPYFLYLGWIDPRKNPQLLVQSFAKVADSIGPWKLALVGPDSYGESNALQACIASHGLQDRVVMPGLVRGKDKLAWLKNAECFVLPSAGEGLSLAMLEAIACGLPCLLTKGCNFPEIETWDAGEVLPLDVSAWADALPRWAGDAALRERASGNARRLFEAHHTIDRIAERLESIYNDALGSA